MSRIAKPLPLTMKPAARPRARLPNHAATSDIIGTLAAPLPRPVRKYSTRSAPRDPARLTPTSETPASSSAPATIRRGPTRAATIPLARTAMR